MLKMPKSAQQRGPEGPKRLQYGPKAPLEASGGVLGGSREAGMVADADPAEGEGGKPPLELDLELEL